MRPFPAWLPAAAVFVAGCGSASAGDGAGETSKDAVAETHVTTLETRLEELEDDRSSREARIRELEGHLALSRAETRDLERALERRRRGRPTETVRIGGSSDASAVVDPNGTADQGPGRLPALPPDGETARDAGDDDDDEPRPVLRLYGTRAPTPGDPGGAPTLDVPAPPPGVSLTIPVRTVPWDPRTRRAAADVPPVAPRADPARPATAPPADAEARSYRSALRLLTDRRYDAAVDALTRHIDGYPDGRLTTSAVYWRGEARYALRRYDQALVDFRRVLARSPGHRRAPEALYKVALCLRRRGDRREAAEALRALQARYPGSPAARMAASAREEDAS